jgi:hypothetical protein
MDPSHDSPTILGQLRKGQAETNVRLEAIRVELLRLNSHLEQLAAAVSNRQHDHSGPYPLGLYLSRVVPALRPKALAMWFQARNLPRGLLTQNRQHRTHPAGNFPGELDSSSP